MTRVSGKPKWEKSSSSLLVAALVVLDFIGWMHGYLDKASPTTNQFWPLTLTAWSMWTRDHGFSGFTQAQGCVGCLGGILWCSLQDMQFRQTSAMSALIPGSSGQLLHSLHAEVSQFQMNGLQNLGLQALWGTALGP